MRLVAGAKAMGAVAEAKTEGPGKGVAGTWGMGSDHPGGCNALFVDGSVHFLPNSVSTTVVGGTTRWGVNITLLMELSTRAGGEVIPEGSY